MISPYRVPTIVANPPRNIPTPNIRRVTRKGHRKPGNGRVSASCAPWVKPRSGQYGRVRDADPVDLPEQGLGLDWLRDVAVHLRHESIHQSGVGGLFIQFIQCLLLSGPHSPAPGHSSTKRTPSAFPDTWSLGTDAPIRSNTHSPPAASCSAGKSHRVSTARRPDVARSLGVSAPVMRPRRRSPPFRTAICPANRAPCPPASRRNCELRRRISFSIPPSRA